MLRAIVDPTLAIPGIPAPNILPPPTWDTKYDGWPDVILCFYDASDYSSYFYHYFNKIEDGVIMYSGPRSEYSNIIFNSDGEYQSRDSYEDYYSIGCEKSIKDLTAEKRVLYFVKSKDRKKGQSILENFPGAIRCGQKDSIFYLSKTSSSNSVVYKKI